MEPVTHMLTGAVLARAGFNRKAAYATVAMTLTAEMPDLDVAWSAAGPVTGFLHHRGITHTLLAVPFEAALVTALFWAWHRWRARPTRAPFHAGWLFAGTLVALLSHLLLDWTNNYGVRPFFPFNPHWYAGSFVFIFEPVLFAILLAALVLPALFGLVNAEVGARRPVFRGRPSAIAALVAVAALYIFRYAERDRALRLTADTLAADTATAAATDIFASPYPGDPFTWHIVAASPESVFLATADTRRNVLTPGDRMHKPAPSLAILAAKRSSLGRAYLDWSMYPVLSELPAAADDPRHPLSEVTFADGRFLYDTFLLRGRKTPPLTGTVILDMQAPEGERVVSEVFDGRVQK